MPAPAESPSCPQTKKGVSDWLFNTIFLTLLPLILVALINLLKWTYVDVHMMICDGELFLSAFMIAAPSFVSAIKQDLYKKNLKALVYSVSICALLPWALYAAVRTYSGFNNIVVYITSCICLALSVYASWQVEKHSTKGE